MHLQTLRHGGFYFESCFSPHNHHLQLVGSLLRHPSSTPNLWWTSTPTAADRSLALLGPGIAHWHRPQSSLGSPGCADGVARLGDAPHPQAGGQQERRGGEEESAHGVQVGLDFSTLVRPLMSSQAGSIKQGSLDFNDVKRRERARPSPPLFEIEQQQIAHPPAAHLSSSKADDTVPPSVEFVSDAPCYCVHSSKYTTSVVQLQDSSLSNKSAVISV